MHGEEQGWEAAEISLDVGCSYFTPVLENWSGRLQCQSLSGCFGLCPLRIALTCFTPITGVLKSCVGRRARDGKEEEEEEVARVLGCSPLWVPGAPRWSHGGASPHPPCPCPPLSLPLATLWLAYRRWQNLHCLGVLLSLPCIAGYWNQVELAEVWFLQGNTGPGTWFVPVSSSTVLLWAGRAEPRPGAPRV